MKISENTKVAVTGASGHVGNVLCRQLLERGASVKALVHRNEKSLVHVDVEKVKGDILNPASLESLCQDADIVFHLAARISIDRSNEKEVMATNIDGTSNLLNTCNKANVKKLVHFSSIHVYDPCPIDGSLNEEREFNLHSTMGYEKSKLMGEKLVHEAIESGLQAVIINPTAIIGPWDFGPSFQGKALIKMYNNALPMLVPYGYDWVDVRDVVLGAINAAEKGSAGEKFILSGHFLTMGELSAHIGRITGRKTPSFMAPLALAYIGLPFITAWARIRNETPLYTRDSLAILKQSNPNVTSAKAEQTLGYTSRPIEDTLRDTIEWFKQNGLI